MKRVMVSTVRVAMAWIVISFGLLACSDEPSAAGPWQRIDLWFDRPHIENLAGERLPHQVVREKVPYGAAEVRDLEPEQRRRQRRLSAAGINVLEQYVGSRLVKRVQLGQEPYFSFVPLPLEAQPCRCLYSVAVRDADGVLHPVAEIPAVLELRPPPARQDIDLQAFAGQQVELVLGLEVEEAPGATDTEGANRAYWGSAAVYSRQPAPAGTDLAASGDASAERPNIVWIGVDTLRARELGAWGREPSITPALDRLATESDVWLDAYTAFNNTNPSFTSMMTGLYGKNHGVYANNQRMPEDKVTMAELLGQAGYSSAAIFAARHLHGAHIHQGFGEVAYPQRAFRGELPIDLAMSWIDGREQPFFLFVHLYDVHTPHTPPYPYSEGYRPAGSFGLGPVEEWQPFRELGPRQFVNKQHGGEEDLYDGELAYLDRQVDRLLAFLESRRLFDNTIFVFVADHGENLEEHGVLYGHAGLWETTTHVPLMIRWPGEQRLGRRLEGLVQTLDLFPTLLRAAGLEPPSRDGLDLLELSARERPGRPVVFTEHANERGAMVRTARYKYFRSHDNPNVPEPVYFYDLEQDPEELNNLAGRGLAEEERLAALLDRWLAQRAGVEAEELVLSEEERDQLRALGYLQ